MTGEYRIREVDGDDDEFADTLRELDSICFPGKMGGGSAVNFSDGLWWLCFSRGQAVGYIGIVESTHYPKACYFKRVGVLPGHTGQGLQSRMTRTFIRKARQLGYLSVVTDCTICNPASANSLIRTGFKVFVPDSPWALANSIYWRRDLTR